MSLFSQNTILLVTYEECKLYWKHEFNSKFCHKKCIRQKKKVGNNMTSFYCPIIGYYQSTDTKPEERQCQTEEICWQHCLSLVEYYKLKYDRLQKSKVYFSKISFIFTFDFIKAFIQATILFLISYYISYNPTYFPNAYIIDAFKNLYKINPAHIPIHLKYLMSKNPIIPYCIWFCPELARLAYIYWKTGPLLLTHFCNIN